MKKTVVKVIITCLKAVLALGIFILCSMVVYLLFDLVGIDRKVYAGVTAVATNVLALAVLYVLWKIDSRLAGEFIRFAKPQSYQTVCTVLVAMGLTGLIVIYMLAARYLSDYLDSFKRNLDEYRESVDRYSDVSQQAVPFWDSLLYVVATFTVVPICEEFVFRGMIMGQMKRIAPVWAAVLIQAVVFGLMHGITIQVGYAVICGLVLGVVYQFCDNLWMPILVHAVFNLLGSSIPGLLALEQLGIPNEMRTDISLAMTMGEYFLMFPAGLAFVYMWYRYKKNAEERAKIAKAQDAEPSGEGAIC